MPLSNNPTNASPIPTDDSWNAMHNVLTQIDPKKYDPKKLDPIMTALWGVSEEDWVKMGKLPAKPGVFWTTKLCKDLVTLHKSVSSLSRRSLIDADSGIFLHFLDSCYELCREDGQRFHGESGALCSRIEGSRSSVEGFVTGRPCHSLQQLAYVACTARGALQQHLQAANLSHSKLRLQGKRMPQALSLQTHRKRCSPTRAASRGRRSNRSRRHRRPARKDR